MDGLILLRWQRGRQWWSHAALGVAPYSHVRVMVLLAATGGSHGIQRA
jgi:hypothetical protein